MAAESRIRLQTPPPGIHRPAEIPPSDRLEAAAVATIELARLRTLLTSLGPDEWIRATPCPGWTVRDVVAHVCGVVTAFSYPTRSGRQFYQAARRWPAPPLDSMNAEQIAQRSDATPADLIAELEVESARGVHRRQMIPEPLRRLPVPIPGFEIRPWRYLLNELFSREVWMHRLDICRALDREPELTADHDGRIISLVVRDVAEVLPRRLEQSIRMRLELTGPAGGWWEFADGGPSEATVTLDAIDYCWFLAGRTTLNELTQAGRVTITGAEALARRALVLSRVPF